MENLSRDLKFMYKTIKNLEKLNINDINLEKTVLFIVDINVGFAKNGLLYSERIEKLIHPIKKLGDYISEKNGTVIAFTDCHTKDSIELKTYPVHCLEEDNESDVVEEIKTIKNIKVIPKNSTNGFFCIENEVDFNDFENVIVVGACTDICVYQFVITLKSYLNQNNIYKRIIVPIDLVDTYDISYKHNAKLMNIVFFYSMMENGIEVIKNVK